MNDLGIDFRVYARVTIWGIAASVLVWVGACGDTTPSGPSVCDLYTSQLRDCGFLTEGEWQGCQDPETEEKKCELQCATDAECAAVLPLACEETRTESIETCTLECSTTTCDDGSSVHKDKLCDMTLDCNDSSDEKSCPDSFLCDDGSDVLEDYWQCDGISDCSDGSDEAGCAVELCDGATGSPGAVTTNGGTRCRKAASKMQGCGLLSGGFWDCDEPDGEEACVFDCLLNQSCDVIESFTCQNSYDEDSPPSAFLQCYESCGGSLDDFETEFEIERSEEFECADGDGTYPSYYVCDGLSDCGDGSDEKGCDGFKTCDDGKKTIKEHRFCNSATDCEDGSDEDGCAVLDCDPENLLDSGDDDSGDGDGDDGDGG